MLVLGIILLALAIFFLALALATNDSAAALLLIIVTLLALCGLGTIIDYKNAYDRVYRNVEAETYYVDTLVTRKMCGDIMSSDTTYIIHYKTPDDIKREQKMHKDDN